MSRLAVFAALGMISLAGCVPEPGNPYGYGYGYASSPSPYYGGGGYAPYYAPAAPAIIVGGERDYRDRGYRDGRYREQYREQRAREDRPRQDRGDQGRRDAGNRNENQRPRSVPGPNGTRIEGNTIHIN